MARRVAERGFTLMEFLIATVLLAIFIAMALPSFQGIIANNRVKSASEQLQAALFFTRSEAVKRNQTVSLSCKTGGCQNGWTVTVDVSGTQLAAQNSFGDVNLQITGSTSASVSRNGRATTTAAFNVIRTDKGYQRCVRLYLSGLSEVSDAGC
ncbi:GspH/FimT family pseudopilin [Vogesella oryzae]|uniref:GspH/FimT family pseudopilin n=1 Tax=Vogesella oryzae TaxID=1735285 RepID=UPI00158436D8|nr:GspH/FimT family pseudopilin [Vogesella oryzae]